MGTPERQDDQQHEGSSKSPELTAEHYKFAETSFKTILDADIHQDNKANRILSAMAFLTAATAGIFSKAYSPSQPVAEGQTTSLPVMTIFGVNASLLAYTAYLFFVILGALLYLNALGPALNIPSRFGTRTADGKDKKVASLLFFAKIGELNRETWSDYWHTLTPADLQREMTENFIFESHLIAQKATTKIFFMSFGSRLFKIAIVFLSPLIASMFSPNPWWFLFALLLALSGLFLTFTLEAWRPPQESRSSVGRWSTLTILTVIGAIILLLVLGGVL
jgi:hypothetical protein